MPKPERIPSFALLLLAGCSGCDGGVHALSPEAKAQLAAKADPKAWEDLDAAHPGTRLRDPRTDIVFRRVPKGTFTMGNDDARSEPLEKPAHTVTLTRDYLLAETEVTVAQWQRWLGEHGGTAAAPPSRLSAQYPITHLLYAEAEAFCATYGYRLPTEAEWEHACTAGVPEGQGPWRTDATLLEYAWFQSNSGVSPHPVATRKANPLGLCDMLGNVWEYCADWCGPYPGREPQTDPTGPPVPVVLPPFLHGGRALRGGSWFSLPGPKPTQRADEEGDASMRRNGYTGFRPARSIE
jgi:formylglycine-generating enzyme required for sulfatase activity